MIWRNPKSFTPTALGHVCKMGLNTIYGYLFNTISGVESFMIVISYYKINCYNFTLLMEKFT
jgi:hypothetical protein